METNNIKEKIARGLVILKFTMQRGYQWCQLPTLTIIGAGVMYPYVKEYGLKLWQVAIIAFLIFLTVGYIDKKFRLIHEESTYTTSLNPLLMEGLKGKLK